MPVHFKGQTTPEESIPPILPMIVFYNIQSLFVIQISGFKNVKVSHGCLLIPWILSRFTLTIMLANIMVKEAPKRPYPLFCQWLLLQLTIFVGDQKFQLQKCRNFLWRSVMKLAMLSVGPHVHAYPFWRLNELQSLHTPPLSDDHVLYKSPSLLVI